MTVQFGCFFDTDLGKLVHPDVVPAVRAILSTPHMSAVEGLLAVEAYLERYACSMRHDWNRTSREMASYSWGFVNRLGNGVQFLPSESLDIPYPVIPGYEYLDVGDPYFATIMFDNLNELYFIGTYGKIAESMPSDDDLYDMEYTEDDD